MKVLYYDCFSGISGDMNLGALVDVGVDAQYLIDELNKLPIDNEFELIIEKKQKMGITGTKVNVILKQRQHDHADHSNHYHSEDPHHHHAHDDKDPHKPIHSHHTHRSLKEIEEIINSSTLSETVKKLSLVMFYQVAEAEGKIHGKSLYEVHFHEVGAVDSIVDIVGAAICIDYLKVDKIYSSTIEVGSGMVKCAHGLMPVPAPAVSEILKSIPIHKGRVQSETTTPTGAAILKSTVEEFTDELNFNIQQTGYGVGTKDFEIPNVLRVFLGELENLYETERQILIETNIDDMNPEFFSYIEEMLFKNGALDVYKTPITMKRGRPATLFSILVNEKNATKIQQILFHETSTLGIRQHYVNKIMLNRIFEKVDTKYGQITIKKGILNGKIVKVKPEFSDCERLAKEKHVPIKEIYDEIYRMIK